jgi:phage protein D
LPVSYTLLIAKVPAPPALLDALQEISVDASTDEASVFRLRFGISQTATGDWTILELDLFRPLVPVSIRVQAGLGVPEAIINGYVSRLQITYAEEPGKSVLEVTGMDATLLMNLQEKVMPWPNLPDSAIAAAIFGQYAVVPQIQPTSPSLVEPEGTTTQRATDIRFLRRLAQRNGFDCYVQPEPLTGIDFGYFQPPSLVGLPEVVLSVNMGEATNVTGFTIQYEMTRPTTALASGLDISTKSPQPAVAPAALQIPLGVEGTLLRVIPPPIVRPADTGQMRTADLQLAAQAIVDRSTWVVVARGQVGSELGVLRPGKIVNIRGTGRVFSGSYYVTRVTHTITKENYGQSFEAKRNAVEMTGAELFVSV